MDAVRDELVGDEDRELWVQWRQYLRSRLDDRHVDALPGEVLGHLEPDEPGADHDRGCWCDIDLAEEKRGVFDGSQCASPVVSGYRWPYRRRAHAEHELVVTEVGLGTGDRGTGRDGVRGAIDRDDLVVNSRVEAEAVEELFRGLECEVFFLLDQPAHEVRQATVGKRDMAGSLENGDGRVAVETAQTSRGRHPSGDAADDDHAHCRVRTCEMFSHPRCGPLPRLSSGPAS